MLGLRDNLTLSLTKLRVRRVRLAVTLVVSGIIFTVLVFTSLVGAGVSRSLTEFTKTGLLNHYLTSAVTDFNAAITPLQDPKVIAHAKELDAARIAAEVKEAKRLGLDFDPKTASHAVGEPPAPGGDNPSSASIDASNPAGRQALVDIEKGNSRLEKIKKAAAPYHPTAIYTSFPLAEASFGEAISLSPMIDGKEQVQAMGTPQYGERDSITNFQNELNAFSSPILKPFTLDGTSLDVKPGDPLPVLAPIDAAEKLLNVPVLSKGATAAQKIERLSDIRNRAKGLKFKVCYRNAKALDIQNQAKQQAAEIAANKSNKDYAKPSLVYGQDNLDCKPTPVVSDTRTAAEKAQAAKQLQFDQEFGAEAPVTKIIEFKVVGVLSQPGTLATAPELEAAVTSLFTSSLGEGWFIPIEAAGQDPTLGPIINDQFLAAYGIPQYFVDFSNRHDQKQFIDEQGCVMSSFSSPDCTGGKMILMPYGNPLAAFEDAEKGFNKVELILLGIIAALAAIVMMGTIGKIIADSRKETSVFRAVGAKRIDVIQIYVLYALILASLGYLSSVVLSGLVGWWLESHYGPDISAQAVLAFNSPDLHKSFHVIGVNLLQLLEIYGFALVTGLIGAALPLAFAMRRNPIKDMREE